jgi:hypothetical protein
MEPSPYKFNFNDLSRFLEDFSYILHKGGATKRLSERFKMSEEKKALVEKIIKWVKIFFQLCLVVVAVYTLYIILFKGYPRILLDFITFKFFHKEKPDSFLKEGNLLVNNFKFLSKQNDSCLQSYDMYKSLYGGTNLSNLIDQFEKTKLNYYGKYKYDEQYINALKEFYLFYDKINNVNPKDVRYENRKITIEQYDVYELLLTYRKILGDIQTKDPKNGGNKSNDQLMYELYKLEQNKNFITITGIKEIHNILIEMGKEFTMMNNNFISKPIIPYLIIPVDDNAINTILKDINKMKDNILNRSVYMTPYNKLSDNAWYMIEYIMSISDPNQYNTFVKSLPQCTDDTNKIIYYLNLSREQKIIAEKRILNYSQNAIFYEYIKQRPIFAHIYFSKSIDQSNKPGIYGNVMNGYKILGDCGMSVVNPININNDIMKIRLINLQKNGYVFKQFINTVSYLNLYLNNYRHDLTIMYEKLIISDNRFLKELWMPFVNDIFINRIGSFTKKTFSSQGMGGSYSRFLKFYKSLGDELNRMIKAVFMAFFTSQEIEQPQETDTGDNN